MKVALWGVIALLTLGTTQAVGLQYTRELCKESPDFDFKFDALVTEEPALKAAFEKLVADTGSTRVRNCFFEVPTVNGTATDGPRRLIIDKTWYKIEKVSGLEKQVYQQRGIVYEYTITDRTEPNGQVFRRRHVTSLQVCHTPESCQRFGLPK